jgi:hypothetical protein
MKLYCINVELLMDSKNPPWAHMYEFEKSLADFLAAHGVQAEKVEYPNGGQGELSFFLSPIEDIPLPQPPKQTSPAKILKKLQKGK